jgi:hypothetical protein
LDVYGIDCSFSSCRSKKSQRAAEQDLPDVAAAREEWRASQGELTPERLVFIDETGAATNMARRYGRCPRGQRLVRPLDIQELVARLGLHGRGARDFFDALVALDLLQRDAGDRYANRPDTALYLDRRKPTYLGGLLEHLNARHYQNWNLLTRALQTGTPQSGALATGSYPSLYADRTIQEIFLNE